VTDPARTRLAGACVALLAVVRRDLVASRRGARTYLVRMLTMVAAGVAALVAWHSFSTGGPAAASGSRAVVAILATVVLLAFVQALVICVSALRAERQAGLLDLVLLAGVSPRMLVLGRTISTWIGLEAMIVACLPAMGLLWLFRVMSPEQLVIAVGALSAFNFALAAAAVAVSAWAQSAGMALALGALMTASWAGLTLVGAPLGWDATLMRALIEALSPTHGVRALDGLIVFGGAHAMLAAVGLAAAALGVERRTESTRPDVLLLRVERRRLPMDATLPLTWLMQRLSAPARPIVQVPFVGIAAIIGLLALGLAPEATALVGTLLALSGLVGAAAAAATSIAPARERGQWLPLAATSLDGRRLILDMAHAAASATLLPTAVGTLLVSKALSRIPDSVGAAPLLVIAMASSWAFVIVAGLVASLASRTSAAALALTGAILVGEPLLGAFGWSAWSEASHVPFGDLAGGFGWLLLVLDALILGTWLVLRAGFGRRGWLVPLAFLPAGATLTLPLFLGDTISSAALAGSLLGVGCFGLILWPLGARRRDATLMLVGVLMVAAFILTPAFLLAAADDGGTALAAAGGGLALLAQLCGFDAPPASQLVLAGSAGALHQIALAALLILAFRPHLDRWLGRAG
jgi:hypothetical protein